MAARLDSLRQRLYVSLRYGDSNGFDNGDSCVPLPQVPGFSLRVYCDAGQPAAVFANLLTTNPKMIPMTRLLLTILLGSTLFACASVPSHNYKSPGHERVARLQNSSNREGTATWETFFIVSVDGKYVNRTLFDDPMRGGGLKLEPGVRRLVVEAGFNRGWRSGGPFNAVIQKIHQVEEGRRYQIVGRIEDELAVVWLVDLDTGEPASVPVAQPWRKAPPGPVTLPVPVPMR